MKEKKTGREIKEEGKERRGRTTSVLAVLVGCGCAGPWAIPHEGTHSRLIDIVGNDE